VKLPRNWKVQPAVKHDLTPAVFAWEFVKARAKHFGLPWKVSVSLGNTEISGRWYGHAYGRGGRGKIKCWINHKLPISERQDPRYKKDQPWHLLWGNAETICYLFAHEFGHVLGYGGDKAGEMSCNNLGWEAVQAWRGRQYDHPACLI